MAVVILGGLVTSTLLNLFILPAFSISVSVAVLARYGKPDCSGSGTQSLGVSKTNVSWEE